MGGNTTQRLLTLVLCCLCLNLSAQEVKPNTWGFSIGAGYSQFIPSGTLSQYVKSGPGFQVGMDILYGKLGVYASMNGNSTKVKQDFELNSYTINTNDKMKVDIGGVGLSYAVVNKDYFKVSPLAGVVWSSLVKEDITKATCKPTGIVGIKFECNAVTSIGGLTDGLCLPLYVRYNYCFPQEYSNVISGGAHFISVGLELYMKGF